jgi:hypothetical protein
MATQPYISSRQKPERLRPQGIILAEGFTYDTTNLYLPTGSEINSDGAGKSFIILSDDNRSSIDISKNRLEQRERMINGRMRSYHIADKIAIGVSWEMLPSRSFVGNPNFSSGVEFSIASSTQTDSIAEPTEYPVSSVSLTDSNTKLEFITSVNHNLYVGGQAQLSGVSGITAPQTITDVTSNTFKILGTTLPTLTDAKVEVVEEYTKVQFTTTTTHTLYVGARVKFFEVSGITDVRRVTDVGVNTFKVFHESSPVLTNNSTVKVVEGSIQGIVTELDLDDDEDTPVLDVKSSGSKFIFDQQYTTDGGAGGNDLLNWYENHPGSFYVLLAYDKNGSLTQNKYSKLGKYNQAVEVYFSNFSYTIEKRGQQNHDFWNISFSLEEV